MYTCTYQYQDEGNEEDDDEEDEPGWESLELNPTPLVGPEGDDGAGRRILGKHAMARKKEKVRKETSKETFAAKKKKPTRENMMPGKHMIVPCLACMIDCIPVRVYMNLNVSVCILQVCEVIVHTVAMRRTNSGARYLNMTPNCFRKA